MKYGLDRLGIFEKPRSIMTVLTNSKVVGVSSIISEVLLKLICITHWLGVFIVSHMHSESIYTPKHQISLFNLSECGCLRKKNCNNIQQFYQFYHNSLTIPHDEC